MTGKARILVVDDESELTSLVRRALEREGFDVVEARDGEEALRLFAESRPDLVVLDIMLPGVDGFEVCRRLRANSDVPVILLTARAGEEDRVSGFELGADDYVVKPFSVRELVARVKAQLRRYTKNRGPVWTWKNVTVDEESHQAFVDGHDVPLTATEFALLATMIRSPGRVYTRDQLLTAVWGERYFGDVRTVDVHIRHLREKLQEAGAPPLIETVRGVGYRVARPT